MGFEPTHLTIADLETAALTTRPHPACVREPVEPGVKPTHHGQDSRSTHPATNEIMMTEVRDYVDDPISSGEEDAVPAAAKDGHITEIRADEAGAEAEPMVVDDADEMPAEQSAEDAKGSDDEGEEGEEDGEPEWEVEAIVGARKYRGVQQYHIKWKGFDDEDNTWEPLRNINCPDLVKAYWDEHPPEKHDGKSATKNQTQGKRTALGGVERRKRKGVDVQQVFNIEVEDDDEDTDGESASGRRTVKKRRADSPPARRAIRRTRTSGGFATEDAMSPRSRRARRSVNYKIPDPEEDFDDDSGASMGPSNGIRGTLPSWDNLVDKIETIDVGEREGELQVFILWKNGTRSTESALIANKKCPQAIIKFYEEHIRFTRPDNVEENASTGSVDGQTAPETPVIVEKATISTTESVRVEDLTDGTILVSTNEETTSATIIESIASLSRADELADTPLQLGDGELDFIPQTRAQNEWEIPTQQTHIIPTTS
ncbi:Chromobox protein 1 [Geranomyces michiganensis]|nr:Chromobox protein 1 [Geranomyces michiganensis]